jgi:predicted nucleic acid-binding protein
MATLYIDTSSLGRVLLAEPDAPQIRQVIAGYREHRSSALLLIELRRLARRTGLESQADRMLSTIDLTPITSATIDRASRLDPIELRSLDALHLDAAIELHRGGKIDAVLTHDDRLRAACAHHRIPLALT